MSKTLLYTGWSTFAGHATAQRRLSRAGETVIRRWQHMYLAPAFGALRERAVELKGIRNARAKVLGCWHRHGLSRGFFGWSQLASHQRRLAMAASKIVRRWAGLAISPALSRWIEHTRQSRRLSLVGNRLILRLISLKLTSCLKIWLDFVCCQRDAKECARSDEQKVCSHEFFPLACMPCVTSMAYRICQQPHCPFALTSPVIQSVAHEYSSKATNHSQDLRTPS